MNITAVLISNFLVRNFKKKTSWILTFAAPAAAFMVLFLLIYMGTGSSDEGFYAVGMILFFILIQGSIICSSIIKDRTDGVLDRILSAPVKYRTYSLSIGIACYIILVIQTLFSVICISLIFPSRALLLLKMLPLFLVFGLTSTGTGFLLSGLAANKSQSDFIAYFAAMLTSIMGGVMFPVEFMSPVMKKVSYIFPQRWAMHGILELQNGSGYDSIMIDFLILILFTLLMFAVHGVIRKKN